MAADIFWIDSPVEGWLVRGRNDDEVAAIDSRKLVIARSLDDGWFCVFTDFRAAQGYVEATDVVDGEWGTFYGLDGEILHPEVDENGWTVRLIPASRYDLAGPKSELATFAAENGLDWDGSDPRDFVNAYWRDEWSRRWPRWPRWLDRWMHGVEPPSL